MRCELLSGTKGAGPDLVYVPGIDGTGELLLGAEPRLERAFRLTRLRYACEPEPPRDGDSYEQLAAGAVARMSECGVTRALLLGDSFGVGLALRIALDHPERVAGLALVNGFAHFPDRVALAASRAVFTVLPRPLFDLGRRYFAPRTLFGARREPEVLRRFQALAGLVRDDGYPRRLALIARLDLRPRLSELELPVALFASQHDRVVPALRAAHELQARLPDATLEVLPRSGHIVLPLSDEPWVERLQALAERAGLRAPSAG